MKKILSTSILAAVFLCPCFSQAVKSQTKPAVQTPTIPNRNVRITLSTKAQKFTGDENVVLQITLENLSDEGFGIPDQEVGEFYQIQFTGPKDKAPQPLKLDGRMYSGGYSVPAHGKRVAYVYLNHVFDTFQKGAYTVKVSTKFEWGKVKLDATSEPMTFEITSFPTLSVWSGT